MQIKIFTILIMGAVFAAGLVMGFSGYIFAAENYNSSKSNTSTGIINRDVGNLLIDYGYGGEVVNQVTEALAVGVTTDGLRAILSGTSARSPAVVEEVLQKLEAELKRLGMGIDSPEKEFTEGAVPSAVDSSWKSVTGGELRTPDATGAVPSAAEGIIKDILPSTVRKTGSQGDYFPKSREELKENAKVLRENFKFELKNVRLVGYVVVALRQNICPLPKVISTNITISLQT